METVSISKGRLWTSYVLSALVVLMLSMGIIFGLTKNPQAIEGMQKYGYPAAAFTWIVLAELLCVVLYVVPRTAVLGLILLTGYMGGAVATHVRAGELDKFPIPIIVCMVAWLAVWLRDARLAALIPIRR